ncbi:hypothetical protein LOC67_05350 [Stieleria sp. JC731]|uniref:3-hydroxyacyl-ACP dehydratase FabZ family protein n=1 Tax=Pirellulaceae TaxID=2691357 RepID=UPI001E58CFB3|nr:hypothetical protein [Stieleria sp. JC731]MCC9599979.1 hypothetical protein [Stieleria sp. JC731]
MPESPAYYQHRFETVEQYLHHRTPYRMVDSIEKISHDRIETSAIVAAEAFYMPGHFPGAPIVPGAMMQEMTTQSAGILIAAEHNPMEDFDTSDPNANEFALGVLVRINHARFRGFARPGDKLSIVVELIEREANCFQFVGRVIKDGNAIMKNGFQLANIPSAQLVGTQV